MDQQLLQRTRYLLQTRFRRIRTTPPGNFALACKQVMDWIERHPVLNSILQHLENVPGDHHQEVKLLLGWKNGNGSRYFHLTVGRGQRTDDEPPFIGYTPSNLEEHASACLQILRAAIQRTDGSFYSLLAVYLSQEEYRYPPFKGDKDALEAIKDTAIRDLYEYLDERLDGINAVNGLLRKYKQNVEWFQRERIESILTNGYGGKTGERAVALHLQQYIFDQGVDFVVEPSSVSGEVDLLLRDPSGQYTIIDAKYIKENATPSEITRKIAEGLNQVARYCDDYNQHEGFLAVFVDDNLSILIDLDQADNFKYFKIGGNTIYYIEINIAERPSASKAGKAKQIHINRDDLIERIEKIQQETSE